MISLKKIPIMVPQLFERGFGVCFRGHRQHGCWRRAYMDVFTACRENKFQIHVRNKLSADDPMIHTRLLPTPRKFVGQQCKQSGFTLIEMIVVIVLISILSTIGGSFMIRTIESYHESVNRSQLIQRGRQSIERITRQLRVAAPNSIQVSGNNLCIEWLPVVGGGNYVDELPDQDNGAAAISAINVAPISFDMGTPEYVMVGALSAGEIYNAAPSSVARYASINTGVIPNVISLVGTKQFQRNSVNQRLFVADHPNQFCVSGGNLLYHEGYTSAGSFPSGAALTGTPPNAGTILAQGIIVAGETPFSIAAGTETRNTIVTLELPITSRGEKIVLRHQVMVRNVP